MLDQCVLLVTKYDNGVPPRKLDWYPDMKAECEGKGLWRVMPWSSLPDQTPED